MYVEVEDDSGAFHLDVRVGEINRGQQMKVERKWPCHQVYSLGFIQNSRVPFSTEDFEVYHLYPHSTVTFTCSNKSLVGRK